MITSEFRRVAIVGAGLIGASFGIAVERVRPGISIVAFDRPDVLRKLRNRGLGWETCNDLNAAVHDADLIYIALPVRATIEALPEIASSCSPHALVTDSGSTKTQICKQAQRCFAQSDSAGAKFIGGHPIAGKETAGMENADAEFFRGSRYVLIGSATDMEADARVRCFVDLLRAIGAEPVWMDPETHDWAMGVVSHMPQMLAIALARVIADESDENGLPVPLAGNGLRDMLRIAGSEYEMWRDICLTNQGNIARSLDRAAQAIDFLRTHLASRELEQEFHSANRIYKLLRKMN